MRKAEEQVLLHSKCSVLAPQVANRNELEKLRIVSDIRRIKSKSNERRNREIKLGFED